MLWDLSIFLIFILSLPIIQGYKSLISTGKFLTSVNMKKLENIHQLIDSMEIFVFDCDGVIWKGDSLISPNIKDVLERLKREGKKLFFVTNNSTKSRKGYLQKFLDLGLTVTAEEILSSSFAAALYFQKHPLPLGKKVYIIGQKGLCEELQLHGIPFLGGEDDNQKVVKLGPGGKVEHDPEVAAVIVGFDSGINYYKIQYAQLCLNENPDCQFIATNLDAVTHLTELQEWAGNGAMVGAIQGCTGKKPIVVGKPAPFLIDYLLQRFQIDRSRVCMVGDRLDTDILFGKENGLKTILTLSGVTTETEVSHPNNPIRPDYLISSLGDFFEKS